LKVKTRSGAIVDVYAVYWGWQDKTYFYGLPDGYGGLLAYDASDVEVVDAEIGENFVFVQREFRGFFHPALVDEAFLADLLELDGDAYKRFLRILGRA